MKPTKYMIIINFIFLIQASLAKADCIATLSNLSQAHQSTRNEIQETQKSKHEIRQRTDRLTNLPGIWGNSWSDYDLRKMKYRENQLFEAELRIQTEKLTNKMRKIQQKTQNQSCAEATIGSRG